MCIRDRLRALEHFRQACLRLLHLPRLHRESPRSDYTGQILVQRPPSGGPEPGPVRSVSHPSATPSGLASCLQPLDGLPRRDDRDALEAAHRQEVALVARGDEIGLASDGRRDDVIVIGWVFQPIVDGISG